MSLWKPGMEDCGRGLTSLVVLGNFRLVSVFLSGSTTTPLWSLGTPWPGMSRNWRYNHGEMVEVWYVGQDDIKDFQIECWWIDYLFEWWVNRKEPLNADVVSVPTNNHSGRGMDCSEVVEVGRYMIKKVSDLLWVGGWIEGHDQDLDMGRGWGFGLQESPNYFNWLRDGDIELLREYLVKSATMAAPPPRLAPGLGVEMYIMSSIFYYLSLRGLWVTQRMHHSFSSQMGVYTWWFLKL